MRCTKTLFVLGAGLMVSGAAFSATSGTPNTGGDAPTYSDRVADILHRKCVGCHQPGQSAPMSLRTYDEARPWAKSIARNVEARIMPPWHAVDSKVGFANDRSLSTEEIDALVRWAKLGAPAGDLGQAPPPPATTGGEWRLGPPDLVVELEEIEIPADGPDQFHRPIGRLGLTEDRWVKAIEILPGDASVVHHVIAVAIKGFDVDPQDGWLGAWAAGTEPMVFPEGTGRLLIKGSNILADMHFHPSGVAAKDRTRIGIHFSDEPPAKELTNIWVQNEQFKIPPGAKNYEVRSDQVFWQSGKILAFAPHMHYRGKDFSYTLHYPDGRSELLLRVENYDFNWQTNYVLAEPIPVPAGSRVECVAHYDNSTDNLANPDPAREVPFGNESFDEMMIGFLDFIVDDGVTPLTARQVRTQQIGEVAQRHPGHVWKVSAKEPEKRTEPDSYAPIYLPEQGEGEFYVIWGGNGLRASRVFDLAWQGTGFSANVDSPYGTLPISGTVEGDTLRLELSLPGDRKMSWDGPRVNG